MVLPPLQIFLQRRLFCIVFLIHICYNYFIYAEGVFLLNTKRIQELLFSWYTSHFRALPWRVDVTPYHVWISEIMLQQTRIEAVIPYYQRFISALPDVAALASVSEDALLKLWEGLGYYSRARNLQKAARVLVEKYHGALPADYDCLLSLPGIGEYTAGAITSIAFSIPAPAVDGNVMRVLSRLTGDDTDVLSTAGKKRFSNLAWELVPEEQPGRFNQALMELGETVCVPNGTPRCDVCPLRSECVACRDGLTNSLPVRIKKTKRRVEQRAVLLIRSAGDPPAVLLHRRDDTGLLAGLWELPNTTAENPLEALDASLRTYCRLVGELPESRHLFSHIEWRMSGYAYDITEPITLPDGYALATLEELQASYPLPSAFRTYSQLFVKLLS